MTYKVEKVEHGKRQFVTCPTDQNTARLIFTAIVNGFESAGYKRTDANVYHKLPDSVAIVNNGSETVAFQVVRHE